MPPRGLVEVSYEVDPYVIPARYWVAVPTNQFLAPNLFSVAIHIGEPNFYDVVRRTRPIGHVRVVNNIAVNTYINVNYIEEVTGENVEIRQVNYAQEPGAVRLGDDAIEIFAPAVEEEPEAEPQQVRTEEEIGEKRGVDAAAEPADEEADQPIEVAEDAPELPEEAVAEEAAPVSEEDVAEEEAEEERPAAAEGEQPEAAPEAAEGEQPEAAPEAAEGEQPEEAPEAAEREQPEAAPEAAEGEQPEAPAVAEEPQSEPPAVAEEPSPQVEERAIGEPEAQQPPEPEQPQQPQQRGGEQDEELLPQ
jgi:hypothetical protein